MLTDPFDDHITVQEAARLLEVSRPTVYRLIERGELRYAEHPVTGRKRLSRQAVVALIRNREGVRYGVGQMAPAPRVSDVAVGSTSYGAAPAGSVVDSIFRLPELGLDFGVDDLSERLDYYRFHGLPDDAAVLSRHFRAGGDQQPHGSAPPTGGD